MKEHKLSFLVSGENVYSTSNFSRMCQSKHYWQESRHCNAEYELHIIVRGTCYLDVETDHLTMQQKQAILIAPGVYHCPRAIPGDFERFSLSFSLGSGELLESLRSKVPCYQIFSVTPDILSTCREFFYEVESKTSFSKDITSLLFSTILIKVFRQLELNDKRQNTAAVRHELERAKTIDDFFQEHFSEHASRKVLAEQMHLSPRQLSRVLLEYYGMTFQEKLVCTRMDHAAHLLRTTEKQIGEIAGIVGYSSDATFYELFRRHFQVTPQRYRSQYRQKKME